MESVEPILHLPQASLSAVAESISHADSQAAQLRDIGLDLVFALHTLLLRDVERGIKDSKDKMLEAVKLRAQEDVWKPLAFESKVGVHSKLKTVTGNNRKDFFFFFFSFFFFFFFIF